MIVSGEALVENLLEGQNSARAYGAEPWKFGYICDMFGHAADMPRIFAKRWAKNNMPVGSAVASGVVASGVCILGVLIETVTPDSSLFWSFFALNLVMLLLSYLPVFPAFLKLRRVDAKTPRPFRVPGSDAALRCIAYVPMALIISAIIFTFIRTINTSDHVVKLSLIKSLRNTFSYKPLNYVCLSISRLFLPNSYHH